MNSLGDPAFRLLGVASGSGSDKSDHSQSSILSDSSAETSSRSPAAKEVNHETLHLLLFDSELI